MTNQVESRLPFQYSLRSLLIFSLAAGALFGWLGREVRLLVEQKEFERALADNGVIICYQDNSQSVLLVTFLICVMFAWVCYKIRQNRI